MLLEIILIEHAINTKLSIKGICVILEFFSYLCGATGRKNTRSRKVVHLYKKSGQFFTPDGQFQFDMFRCHSWRRAYGQECLLV